MNIFMRGDQAVPIIIAKRRVKSEPKVEKKRRFVGLKQGFGTLIYRAIDTVLDCFWDMEQNIIDAGESDVVHYAIDVCDDQGAGGPELIVTKLAGKARPGCGVYCEVISPTINEEMVPPMDPRPPEQEESRAKMVQPKARRPGHQSIYDDLPYEDDGRMS
jgi:hypothetical protein